jgi:SagB-type dehydrogenase family enzyme
MAEAPMSEPSRIERHLSPVSYRLPDCSTMEIFHESTKLSPATMDIDLPRIVAYLTQRRAMLEVSRNRKTYRYSPAIDLPPARESGSSLQRCLSQRRTERAFAAKPLALGKMSSVLHDAIAPTCERLLSREDDCRLRLRPYASGGGLYPVEAYALLLDIEGMSSQVTHYDPFAHRLDVLAEVPREGILHAVNDLDGQLAASGFIVVLTAVMERTTVKYGMRGYRFALIEAGEVTQNLSLCAVAHRLATLPWGGYHDDQVADLLRIDNVSEVVLHCLAVGAMRT